MLNVFGRRLRYGISVAALMAGTQAALLLNAYGGEGMAMVFSGAEPSIKIVDSTTPSNDWDSAWGDGYSVQDFFKTRSFTSYTGPVTTGKRLMQADGYIKPCRHNLLKLSEIYPAAATTLGPWVNASDAVTRGQDDPFGTTKASKVVPGAGAVFHRIYQTPVVSSATTPVTCSYYAKADGYNYVHIREDGSTGAGAVFDLSGSGSVVGTYSTGNITVSNATITAVTGYSGWFRISCVFTPASSGGIGFGMGFPSQSWTSGDPLTAWAGDTVSGAYFAFPMVNSGTQPLEYVSSEAHNLVLQSENFGTTWLSDNSTISSNAIAAPNGQTTADGNIPNAGSASNAVYQTVSTLVSGLQTVVSVYLKVGSLGYSYVELTTGFGSTLRSWFNISTGVAGTINHSSGGIEDVGNGWYRCYVVTTPSASSGQWYISLRPGNGNAGNITGDGATVGQYLFGAQVELASSPGKYVATTSAAVYNQHFDIPVEYNSDGTVKALTREEARTNLALYSIDYTKAAWVNSITTDSASSETDVFGGLNARQVTATGTTNAQLYQAFTGLTSAAAYTYSVIAKAGTASYIVVGVPGVGSSAAWFNLSTGAAGTGQANVTRKSITSLGNGWYRCAVTATTTGTTGNATIFVANGDNSTTVTNGAYIHVCHSQLEAGSTESSVIITGSAAVTRAVDDIYVATTVFPHSATEWTVYQKMTQDYLVSFAAPYSLSNETTAERHDTYLSAAGAVVARTTDGGADQASITPSGTISAATAFKFASAVKVNDFAACLNGGTVGTDVSGTVPTVYRFRLGGGQSNGSPMHGGVHESMYVPTRLADATLQTLATP